MPRGRPKKALLESTKIPANAQTAEIAQAAANNVVDTSGPDKALEDAKGKFTQVITIGLLPDGNIDISTNNPNYAVLNWMLNRGLFELLNHEKSNYMQKAKGS